MAHRAGDFTMELVAGEIKSLEVCQLANLCWDWPTYVVVLQENSLKIGQVADAWREQAREMLAWSFQGSDEGVRGAGDQGPAAGIDGVLIPALEHAMGVLEQVLDLDQSSHCKSPPIHHH